MKAGETVVLYGVGFGPTNPPVPAGKLVSGAAPSPVFPSVTIGGVPATVKFSGIVEAGTFSTNDQPGKPPSDAVVLFDGRKSDSLANAELTADRLLKAGALSRDTAS